MHILKILAVALTITWTALSTPISFASLVMPGDQPYYRIRQKQTQYIFTSNSREFVNQVIAYNEAILGMYERSFSWRLDERLDLILLSPHQQIANAYATLTPNLKTVWYPSGAGLLEEMAESSWLLTLSAHETAHLYQLNSKHGLNEHAKTVFGNTQMVSLFSIPVYIHPNNLTPTFLLEGNAVLNESRLNMGGRLHSGEKRALVLAQIGAGDIDPNRLINDDFRFPFGEEAYLQGGYFSAHLAGKYGIEKTNNFFVKQGSHYLWPLILNNTFREHFGASYPLEIREYVRGMQSLAERQETTEEDSLVDTIFVGGMNHDENRIFFLASDGKRLPRLYSFRKSDRRLNYKYIDLPMGKVFLDGHTPLVAASQKHNLQRIEYSLYSEGARIDSRFRGQIVTDQRAGKTVALDAEHSWLDPQALLNGKPYDIAHSKPILDQTGQVYYFRQNGSQRILYRNRQPLFKFDGFYGKLTEVSADGTVYFIANTDYGSTLYSYSKGEVSRVLRSDRIIDARQVQNNEFLVTEVGSRGHSVFLTKASPKAQTPAVYSYPFASESLSPNFALSNDLVGSKEEVYNGLREMRYSRLDATFTAAGEAGLGGTLFAKFNDPLEYHDVTLGFSGTQHRDQIFLIGYTYSRPLIDTFITYIFKKNWWQQQSGYELYANEHNLAVGLKIPLLRQRRWDAVGSVSLTYDDRQGKIDTSTLVTPSRVVTPPEETYGTLTNLSVEYRVPTILGFFPWRLWKADAFNKLETRAGSWRKQHHKWLLRTEYTHGFPDEFFLRGFAGLAWADQRDVAVEYFSDELSNEPRIPRLTTKGSYLTQTAAYARFEFHKAFDINAHSTRIPVGFNRASPFLIAQGISLDRTSTTYPANIFEWGYGADIELLLFHKIPLRARLLQAVDSRNPGAQERQLTLNFKNDF